MFQARMPRGLSLHERFDWLWPMVVKMIILTHNTLFSIASRFGGGRCSRDGWKNREDPSVKNSCLSGLTTFWPNKSLIEADTLISACSPHGLSAHSEIDYSTHRNITQTIRLCHS